MRLAGVDSEGGKAGALTRARARALRVVCRRKLCCQTDGLRSFEDRDQRRRGKSRKQCVHHSISVQEGRGMHTDNDDDDDDDDSPDDPDVDDDDDIRRRRQRCLFARMCG